MLVVKGQITELKQVIPGIFYMAVYCPDIARSANPGQFVHIRCGNNLDPLLRRPFSLYEIVPDAGTIGIVFQVIGKGTELLAGKKAGDTLDLMGPLGRGFDMAVRGRVLLIGGGIGIVPLLPVARQFAARGEDVTVVAAARTKDLLLPTGELESLGVKVIPATDDGSWGYHGYAGDLAAQILQEDSFSVIYACGPQPMLRQVADLSCRLAIPCQLSLESHMACGVGACLGCVCKINKADGISTTYAKVCTDGPVFWAGEVAFE